MTFTVIEADLEAFSPGREGWRLTTAMAGLRKANELFKLSCPNDSLQRATHDTETENVLTGRDAKKNNTKRTVSAKPKPKAEAHRKRPIRKKRSKRL